MITFEKVLVLKNIPFFEEASELALSDLIMACEEYTFKAGDVIFEEGFENKYLFMILSGTVHLKYQGNLMTELGGRQMFGDTTVLSPAIVPYRAEAQSMTTLLRISGDQLYRVMAMHPSLAKGFIGELSKRLRQEQLKKVEKAN